MVHRFNKDLKFLLSYLV